MQYKFGNGEYVIPVIAIVGRPNVGKSTLFNFITKSTLALVADTPGLTRDRIYSEAIINKKKFILIDTGGFEPNTKEGIKYKMATQTINAIIEADIVLFVVDARLGVLPEDKSIANRLRKLEKTVYLAVNKIDGVNSDIVSSEFYALGFKNLYPISSSHGAGVMKCFKDILQPFKVAENSSSNVNENNIETITFTVIGRPNVGKSTLVNAILGEERVIAFDEPGTTKDSVNIFFTKDNKKFNIIDTAGIRRKGKVIEKIEKFSIIKAIQAISSANVVVLTLDASEEIAEQDATIAGYALDRGKAIVVVVNKWDKVDNKRKNEIKELLKRRLYFLDFASICYVSAVKNIGIDGLLHAIIIAYDNAFIKMSTNKLTMVLKEAIKRQPPSYKGQFRPKLRLAHQGGINPPIIVIHGNKLDSIAKAYTKYLERSFRSAFNLLGTPLKIVYKVNENPFDKK